MAKIVVMSANPYNGYQELKVVPLKRECQIQISNDGDETFVYLNETEIKSLISVLEEIIK